MREGDNGTPMSEHMDVVSRIREMARPRRKPRDLGLERLHNAVERAGWSEATAYVIGRTLNLMIDKRVCADDASGLVFAVSQMIATGRVDFDELANSCDYADVPTFMHDAAGGKVASTEAVWLRWAALWALKIARSR